MAADPFEAPPLGNGHAVPVEVDGVRYRSARAASIALGLPLTTVAKRCHMPEFPTYRWLARTHGSTRGGPLTFEEREIGRPLVEPERWPFDGDLARRKDVIDPNDSPPRVVRRVGWLRCIRCSRPHFSPDVVRVRLCFCCDGLGSPPVGPRLSTLPDLRDRPARPDLDARRPNPSGHRPRLVG